MYFVYFLKLSRISVAIKCIVLSKLDRNIDHLDLTYVQDCTVEHYLSNFYESKIIKCKSFKNDFITSISDIYVSTVLYILLNRSDSNLIS